MKNLKDELQDIIFRNEPAGQTSQLKKVQCFLRGDAETSFEAEKQQRFKNKETAAPRSVKIILSASAQNKGYTGLMALM
ncbi:hypothetical protein [Mucilaginibacter paludis]|uniref:hypothetical protein n=1 Tax=Mucilaginibacter paludis TaxID=423351 RepID=UPI0002555A16|nr:hypothetical protein [Mucilaginibacter paludis]